MSDHPSPTISIITASFNSEKTIKDTIESVLNQTRPPLEYFIMDGGSEDRTVAIAESYRSKFQCKGIKYTVISEIDNGVYDAMNKGILLSSGDLIGMINSDDWYEADALYVAAETYSKTGYDMMFGDLRVHMRGRSFVKKAKITRWVTSRNWNHPTTFTCRSIYNDNLFPCRSLYDDFNLYIKLLREKRNIVIASCVVANYRLGGLSNVGSFRKAYDRMITRYRIYRGNGYSWLYMFECLLTESAKVLYRNKG